MVDVAIYGNLVIDTVFDNFKHERTLGGIANVWSAFQKMDSTVSLELIPITIGSALVYIDSSIGLKVSKPNLRNKMQIPQIVQANVSHIAYLNQLPDLSFMSEITSKITSADLAGTGDFDYDILKFVDYLFVSEDEIKDLSRILKKLRGCAIIHQAGGSTTYDNQGRVLHAYKHAVLQNANVLGAGDHFAAGFLLSKLKQQSDNQSIINAHTQTLKFLTKNNE